MDLGTWHVVLSPLASASAVTFVVAGTCLGTVSGLLPGIHANNVAFVLAAVAGSVPGPPAYVGAAMIAAGVAHTFLDVVPALALGVPDAAMAATALPGHKMVLGGRGREALRLSAWGSSLAVVFAAPLAVPVTTVMVSFYPVVRRHLPVVLVAVSLFLVVTEPSRRSRLGGVLAFLASAALGLLVLDRDPTGIVDAGGMLAPLFAGLFGAPVLFDAIGGAGVPEQNGTELAIPRSVVAWTALLGSVAGSIVAYVPGVSSAIAAVIALVALPARNGARAFLVASSGVNTANTIFALFALVALGTPRTGVMVALENAAVPLNVPLLLSAIVLAAASSLLTLLTVGDWYLDAVARVNYTVLSTGVLCVLIALSYLFAGPTGVAVFAAAALVGRLPVVYRAKRVHCMGVLIGPIVVG